MVNGLAHGVTDKAIWKGTNSTEYFFQLRATAPQNSCARPWLGVRVCEYFMLWICILL